MISKQEAGNSGGDFYPFKYTPGVVKGKGLHSTVRTLGESHVIKIPKPSRFMDAIGALIGNVENNRRTVEDKDLLKKYFGRFMPSTDFVVCQTENGAQLVTVQKKIDGKTLRGWSWEELSANPNAVQQLNALADAVGNMYEETGKIPDVHGGGPMDVHQYNFKDTENVLLEPDGIGMAY